MPLLWSTDAAHWLRRVQRRRGTVVGLALAIAGLALGPGQCTLTLWLAASAPHLTAARRRVVFRHVMIIQGAYAATASARVALIRPERRFSRKR